MQSNSCKKNSESCHFDVQVVNNLDKNIYAIYSVGYPDTNIYNGYNPIYDAVNHKVGSNNSKGIFSRDCYESRFKSETDKLMWFVWDAEVLENTNWDTVKKYNMYLRRFDLSLSDLRNMDWVIIYP